MRTIQYHPRVLEALFQREKIVTLDMMKKALGTTTKMTVFRKLKSLPYRASYSDAGKFYTLDTIAKYDRNGLWSYRQIYFSKHGTLLNTISELVCGSEAGFFAQELHTLVKVRVQTPLLKLVSTKRLRRRELAEGYLYLSPNTWKQQLSTREGLLETVPSLSTKESLRAVFDTPDIQIGLKTFLSILNEKQRRLYVGFESMKLGHGGDAFLSQLTGMDVKTISRGRQELLSQDVSMERIRQAGGGRPSAEKKTSKSSTS